ncbi:hypothetical protein A2291_08510 [candidate division WOR-1 bacterium RIFOXYB2_FULL_42_35]|uniref:Uncharacterized protein n=1 Tax=candidate division WOR-1 bacterium RIFOXYC2_FULL_41_25 TaxID=1802586 RepID=A0A1F4TLZ9_UNCSA|nr:MAG: hypothetical protein A2247_05205 [candidate division WOR-1 bacterium RIFOXYA2_FULL_41_14]OGC23886.1 MAG: hypothetical protein A2291_08510 [candidate division WOR-1 bacterium RIFOXYB2_FULL_42_35]OGC33761.1 MAG: hypothetical protein A2462_00600 [candidate division WOR-1 bacterium RIFOXYC2_FULL_41_25]OGC44182.1 MAG: hypothetical protein A2548_02970 [candidate division WOR-1 bacterium RIFOXYD2_FULL_41_8]
MVGGEQCGSDPAPGEVYFKADEEVEEVLSPGLGLISVLGVFVLFLTAGNLVPDDGIFFSLSI